MVPLSRNRELQARVALEPGWQFAHDSVTRNLTAWLASAQESALAINLMQIRLEEERPYLSERVAGQFDQYLERCAIRLEQAAGVIEDNRSEHMPLACAADGVSFLNLSAIRSDERTNVLVTTAKAVEQQLNHLESAIPEIITVPNPAA